MNRKLLLLITAIITVMVLAACGSDSSEVSGDDADSGKKTNISVGTTQTEDSVFAVALKKFKEEVEANSDNLTVSLHFNSELGGEREMVESVNIGTLEAVWSSTGVISNFVPEMGVVDLPFVFDDKEHARSVMNGSVGEQLAAKLEEQNFKLLTWGENGFRHVTNSERPIEKPEDLEGLKIRTMEVKSHQEAFNIMGATSTPMAWGEVFTSLQQGVIDGQENPINIIHSSKLDEVQKYVSLTGHVYSPTAFLMGKSLFNGLSEEDQQVVLDAAEKAKEENYAYGDEMEQKFVDELKEKGMEFNEVDKKAFKEAVQPVIDKHKDDYGSLYDEIVNQ